jgi:hypothetical protein
MFTPQLLRSRLSKKAAYYNLPTPMGDRVAQYFSTFPELLGWIASRRCHRRQLRGH